MEEVIAQQISNASLPASQRPTLKPAGSESKNPEAYAKYMKAEFFASQRTRDSLQKAIHLLNEAILIDANYAKAYAALADCYQLQGFYQFEPAAVASPRAESAARKALSLDSSIAEAHIALLSSLTDYDWDWAGAEREFQAAIAINPNSAVAYQYYGYALLGMGRGDEALVAMKHAADLDPVSSSVQTSLGWGYYLMRKDQLAIQQIERALELHPDFVPARQMLGILHGVMGMRERSMSDLKQAQKLEPDSAITPPLMDIQLAMDGRKTEAARELRRTLSNSPGSVPDYYVAAAWSAIGDIRQAQLSLEHGLQSRSNWMIFLRYDPRFDNLRSDAKFQQLLSRVNNAETRMATR